MILLDTSFLIRALHNGSAQDVQLRAWLLAGETLAISTIAAAEFLCGPVGANDLQLFDRVLPTRMPFAEDDPIVAAKLFNDNGRRRGSMIDCMIAATALRAGAALATANPSDFRRFESAGFRVLTA